MPDVKPEAKDVYGLPKISIDGGKPEATDRGATRAPILIGGTVTGKTFQTDAVDPRITIDSTSLICHNSAGQSTFQIDIATGTAKFLFGSGINALLQWVDTTGAVISDIGFNSVLSAWTLESTNAVVLTSTATLGSVAFPDALLYLQRSGATSPFAQLSVDRDGSRTAQVSLAADPALTLATMQVTDGTRIASIQLAPAAGSVNSIQAGDTTAQIELKDSSGNRIFFANGMLVFSVQTYGTACDAGQIVVVGARVTAPAAAQAWGSHINWRHLRTNGSGLSFTTPASITLGGAPALNVNANTPQVRSLSYLGGSFTVNSTAIGIVDYLNAITVN